MMAPKDIHVLMPKICEYVVLHGKGTMQILLRVRTLSWRDYPALTWWS